MSQSQRHSGSVGGDLTFGASKTLSTAGLVSTADDLTFAWNNWELAIRTEVELDDRLLGRQAGADVHSGGW